MTDWGDEHARMQARGDALREQADGLPDGRATPPQGTPPHEIPPPSPRPGERPVGPPRPGYGPQKWIDLTAGEYREGRMAVETTPVRARIDSGASAHYPCGVDIEPHIDSHGFREVSALWNTPAEREALGRPFIPLHVRGNRLEELPDESTARIIRAEEILPGDPRYPGPATARRFVARRQRRYAEAAKKFAGRQDSITRMLAADTATTADGVP